MRPLTSLYVCLAALLPQCGGVVGETPSFRRGDANQDAKHDLSDAVTVLSHLFLGSGPLACGLSADVNDDNKLDISDPVYLLNYLFTGGLPPPAPFPDPGTDPTPGGALGCSRCGPAPRRPETLACAGAGAACAVLEDVLIQAEAHFRNDAPAVALDARGEPHVVFSVAEGGYFGFHARREPGGTWTVAEMRDGATSEPVHVATADLVVGSDSRPLALVNSGDLHTALWMFGDGRWERVEELAGLEAGRSHGLVQSQEGCLFAAADALAGEGGARTGIAQRIAGAWEFTGTSDKGSFVGSVIALSPEGEPHLAYWSTAGRAEWLLRWDGGASGPETVVPLGSNSLERSGIAFELTSGPGGPRPHFLVTLPAAEPGAFVLEYITQAEDGRWRPFELAREDPPHDCGQPADEGQTCEYEHTSFRPHRIIADAQGNVRWVFSRLVTKARLKANCSGGIGPAPAGPPPPLCVWEGTQEVTGDLLVGWVENGAMQRSVLAPGVAAAGVDAALDLQGQLHLAVYEVSKDSGNTTVRYLRVGAR